MSVNSAANGRYLVRASTGLTSNFTICAWVRFTALGTYRTMWGQDIGNPDWRSQVYYDITANNIAFNFANVTDMILVPSPSAGVWYFVCAVADSAEAHGYWGTGGALTKVTAGAVYTGTGGTDMYIMDESDLDQTLNGELAGFKIWNANLSQADVEAEYRQLAPKRTANLYTFLPFFDTTNAGKDQSGQGNDFTVHGALANAEQPPAPWVSRSPRRVDIALTGNTYNILPPTFRTTLID